jgi:hypothetical protein
MSEGDLDPAAGPGLPTSTGEFRARPDISASTAQFRAFAAGGGDTERPWAMRTSGRNVLVLAAAVVVVAVLLGIIAVLVLRH